MNYDNARYMVAFYFSRLSLFDRVVSENLDKSICSLQKYFDFKFKQEGMCNLKNLESQKIRKSDLKTEPVSSITKCVAACKTLSIWVTDPKFSREIPPRLIINIHGSSNELFISENKKAYLFFIIGIRKDMDYDYSNVKTLIHRSYIDNQGFFGGLCRDKPYVVTNLTSIEWAYKNFPISIKKIGLSDWDPGFDERF